jgi:hypothetical protein
MTIETLPENKQRDDKYSPNSPAYNSANCISYSDVNVCVGKLGVTVIPVEKPGLEPKLGGSPAVGRVGESDDVGVDPDVL